MAGSHSRRLLLREPRWDVSLRRPLRVQLLPPLPGSAAARDAQSLSWCWGLCPHPCGLLRERGRGSRVGSAAEAGWPLVRTGRHGGRQRGGWLWLGVPGSPAGPARTLASQGLAPPPGLCHLPRVQAPPPEARAGAQAPPPSQPGGRSAVLSPRRLRDLKSKSTQVLAIVVPRCHA